LSEAKAKDWQSKARTKNLKPKTKDVVNRPRRYSTLEMRLYWEFPWVPWIPWESHENGNHSANFMGMGIGMGMA